MKGKTVLLYNAFRRLDHLFSNSSKWTKGAMARSRSGKKTDPLSKSACKWCASGGLIRVGVGMLTHKRSVTSIKLHYHMKQVFDMHISNKYPKMSIACMNDYSKFSFAMLKEAIRNAKNEARRKGL